MLDVMMLGIGVAFVAGLVLYTLACDRI